MRRLLTTCRCRRLCLLTLRAFWWRVPVHVPAEVIDRRQTKRGKAQHEVSVVHESHLAAIQRVHGILVKARVGRVEASPGKGVGASEDVCTHSGHLLELYSVCRGELAPRDKVLFPPKVLSPRVLLPGGRHEQVSLPRVCGLAHAAAHAAAQVAARDAATYDAASGGKRGGIVRHAPREEGLSLPLAAKVSIWVVATGSHALGVDSQLDHTQGGTAQNPTDWWTMEVRDVEAGMIGVT